MPTVAEILTRQPVVGIVGWKNAGKTTLAVRIVEELTRRGYAIATVKHAHHALRLDDEGTDSARHRAAGARQVAVVSEHRWALMTEAPEPDFADILDRLAPCDLVVVEGYKSQPIPKIEARRRNQQPGFALAEQDARVVAIAADYEIAADGVPLFPLDDINGIADFIVEKFALTPAGAPSREP